MFIHIKATMQQYIGIVAFIFWLSPINANATGLCLSLSNFHQQKEHLSIPLGTQQQFALSFIHSVSETPVVDYYQVSDNQKIIQTTERFEHHGAGLPSNISEGIDWEKEMAIFGYQCNAPLTSLLSAPIKITKTGSILALRIKNSQN